MATYDTRTVSRNQIAADLVESVTFDARDVLEAHDFNVEMAALEISEYYGEIEELGILDWPVDQDGDRLDIESYARDYFQKMLDDHKRHLAELEE